MIPQHIKERIAKEAETEVKKAAASITMLPPEQWKMFVDGYMEGYISGAEAEAQRALPLLNFLLKMQANPETWLNESEWNELDKTLATYNSNKKG